MDRIAEIFRLAILLIVAPVALWASEVKVYADPTLQESGLMQFLKPRFSLKTGVRIIPSSAGSADLLLTGRSEDKALPVLARGETVYFVILRDEKAAQRFADWLLSDIGQRAIEQFAPTDGPPFSGAAGMGVETKDAPLAGNAARGEILSYQNCGRCHVIGDRNRMKGIGSTPSFGLLRGLPDWQERFGSFYARIPHPSFSQIKDVTAPFDISRPPPIFPLELTIGQLDDIIAYVATIKPADLGAPLQTQ